MIFSYSNIIKDRFKINNNKYDKLIYNYYHHYYITKISKMIKEYADTINENFINLLLESNNIEIIFYLNNSEFKLNNTIGILIYSKTYYKKEEKIYLLLYSIKRGYRNFGYGKIFLQEFIDFIKQQNKKNKKLIVHSIDSSIEFYKSSGFIPIIDNPCKYKKFFEFEKYNKNACILEQML